MTIDVDDEDRVCLDCGKEGYHTSGCVRVLGFAKADADKPRMDLLPPHAITDVARVLAFGARKYAPGNWRKVDDLGRYTAACLRHVFSYMSGEQRDPETGLHHLSHAACCLLFIVELDLTKERRGSDG